MCQEKKTVGSIGEDIACDYMTVNGYRVIGRNISSRCGEIDLIARKDNMTIFVEVKTRTSSSLGPPYLAVTRRKAWHIIRNALIYLRKNGLLESMWRIDVLSINIDDEGRLENIEHFENAIEGDDFQI